MNNEPLYQSKALSCYYTREEPNIARARWTQVISFPTRSQLIQPWSIMTTLFCAICFVVLAFDYYYLLSARGLMWNHLNKMLVQNIWRNILIIKALLEMNNEWSLVRESAMIIGKTTMKRNLSTIEIWRKPCWGSVHRKNSTLQFGNLTRITLPHLVEVLPSVFVALFFFNLVLFWVPSLVKTEIMKVWVRKKPGYSAYFTLYRISMENRLHEECVHMTSWQPCRCHGGLHWKVHHNLVTMVSLLP